MKNLAQIQERFLREDVKMRLGHLASDLARVASFIEMELEAEAIKSVMRESKFFAEWTVREVEPNIQPLLAEIQSFIAQKELEWPRLSEDLQWRQKIMRQLQGWSEELLRKAGFEVDEKRS